MSHKQRIIELIKADEYRMRALLAAKMLNLPDWLIAAGFVRNIVWGSLFGHHIKLNDIDVIYYCPSDKSEARDVALEKQLCSLEPGLPWSVKNQARMHLKNQDVPYKNTIDAMSYWPEKQTAIGVMLDDNNQLVLRHNFDLSMQFNGQVNHNPARSVEIFKRRIENKKWLKIWPKLKVKI